jgi:type II secretory pathway component PulC
VAKIFGRLALIALLVAVGVTIWYGRVEKKLEGTVRVEQQETAALPEQEPSESVPEEKDYNIILTRNIFKAVLEAGEKSVDEQGQADLEELEETKMQLELLGTVSGSSEDARAIIRDEKVKLEDIYRVGSELQGATITRIERGKVVLRVNGQEEILNIKEPASGLPQQRTSSAGESSVPEMRRTLPSERQVPEALPRRRISFRDSAPSVQEPSRTEVPLPAVEQEDEEETQPIPDDEVPPPGNDEDSDAEQLTK